MGLSLRGLNKLWSGADFWDKDENRKQRQTFARQDKAQAVQQQQAQQQRQNLESYAARRGLKKPTQNVGKVRQFFDANTDQDRYERGLQALSQMIQNPDEKIPLNETYLEQQKRLDNRNAANNPLEAAYKGVIGTGGKTYKTIKDTSEALRGLNEAAGAKEREGTMGWRDRAAQLTTNAIGLPLATLADPLAPYKVPLDMIKGYSGEDGSKKVISDTDKQLNKDLDSRDMFGNTSIVSSKEAEDLSIADIARKSGGTGVGLASEIIPLGKGYKAGIASKGLTKNMFGDATAGLAGSAGEQYAERGNIDLKQVLASGLFSTVAGTASYGGGKAYKGLKGDAKVKPEVSLKGKPEVDLQTPAYQRGIKRTPGVEGNTARYDGGSYALDSPLTPAFMRKHRVGKNGQIVRVKQPKNVKPVDPALLYRQSELAKQGIDNTTPAFQRQRARVDTPDSPGPNSPAYQRGIKRTTDNNGIEAIFNERFDPNAADTPAFLRKYRLDDNGDMVLRNPSAKVEPIDPAELLRASELKKQGLDDMTPAYMRRQGERVSPVGTKVDGKVSFEEGRLGRQIDASKNAELKLVKEVNDINKQLGQLEQGTPRYNNLLLETKKKLRDLDELAKQTERLELDAIELQRPKATAKDLRYTRNKNALHNGVEEMIYSPSKSAPVEAKTGKIDYPATKTNKDLSDFLGKDSKLKGEFVSIETSTHDVPLKGEVQIHRGGPVRKTTGTMFDGDHYTPNGHVEIKAQDGKVYTISNSDIISVKSIDRPKSELDQMLEGTKSVDMSAWGKSKSAPVEGKPTATLKQKPEVSTKAPQDVLDVQNAIKKAASEGDVAQAKVLNDTLPDEYKIGAIDSRGRAFDKTGEYPETKVDAPDEFTAKLDDATAAATKIVEDGEARIRQMGFEPEDIRRKMQSANRGEYEMKPQEIEAASVIAEYLGEGKAAYEKITGETLNTQDFYTPQVKKGTVELPKSREDLLDFGYKEARTDAYDLKDLEYGNTPEIDYLVRSKNRDLVVQKATRDAAVIDGRNVSPDSVKKAAKSTLELQKIISDKSKSSGVLTHDTTDKLFDIGKHEGYSQSKNTYNPSAFLQEPKKMLENAGVWDNGFKQFDNATGYAGEFTRLVRENRIGTDQVGEALERSIREQMPNADASSVKSAIDYVTNRMERDGLSPAQAGALYERAYKNVAKAEMMRLGKTTKFTGNKMNKVVNEQLNGRLLLDSWRKNAAENLDSFIAERINVALRGGNVVSALFELGDVVNVFNKYGFGDVKSTKLGLGKVDGQRFAYSNKYGQGDMHFASADIPQVSRWDAIWADPNTSVAKKIYESYRTAENKLLLFRYIEEMKNELFFRSSEKHYMREGLSGGELVNAVMEDYNKTMLPHKLATANRLVGKFPKSVTQYLNWSLQATKRLGRTLSGSDTGGKFAGLDRGQRVVRGVSGEVLPKIAIPALLGVPIMQVLGMRDFTGSTQGDFTGISDEEKNAMDNIVQTMSLSPVLSAGANFYFADRRNDIADKRKAEGETYRADRRDEDRPISVAKDTAKMLVPFSSQYNKTKQVLDARDKGYYENRDGRIQAEGPDWKQTLQGVITGKGYTKNIREYQDNPNIITLAKGEGSLVDKAKRLPELLIKNQTVNNLVQSVGGEPTNQYKRPLTDEYSEEYKAGDKGRKEDLLKGGRQYNEYFDNLKRNNPKEYDNYIEAMKDHVSPEYWGKITEGGKDLTTFNMMRDRKKQLKKDLGKDYDPMYDLPDGQVKALLRLKSMPTGEDLAQRNILYKEDWYNKYVADRAAYFDNKPEDDTEYGKNTDRVEKWYGLDTQLNSYSGKGEARPEWADRYPLVYQAKQYEYGTPEASAFFKANYEAYNAQKEPYEREKLAIINQMREIEGEDPMSWEAYQQATEIADTDGDDDKKSGWKNYGSRSGGSGGGGGGSRSKNLDAYKYAVDENAGKVTLKGKAFKPKAVSKGKAKIAAASKPKVTLKKSKV